MAILKRNELKQMNEKAMESKILELKKELVKANAQIAMGTMPENPGRIKEIKRTIAKLITLKKSKDWRPWKT